MRSLFKLLKLIYINVCNSSVKIASKTYKNIIKNTKLKKIINKTFVNFMVLWGIYSCDSFCVAKTSKSLNSLQ